MSDTATVTAVSGHKTLVSLIVILVVGILLVEIAGVSSQWAMVVGLSLLSLILLQGMTHSKNLENFSAQYPWIPTGG